MSHDPWDDEEHLPLTNAEKFQTYGVMIVAAVLFVLALLVVPA